MWKIWVTANVRSLSASWILSSLIANAERNYPGNESHTSSFSLIAWGSAALFMTSHFWKTRPKVHMCVCAALPFYCSCFALLIYQLACRFRGTAAGAKQTKSVDGLPLAVFWMGMWDYVQASDVNLAVAISTCKISGNARLNKVSIRRKGNEEHFCCSDFFPNKETLELGGVLLGQTNLLECIFCLMRNIHTNPLAHRSG